MTTRLFIRSFSLAAFLLLSTTVPTTAQAQYASEKSPQLNVGATGSAENRINTLSFIRTELFLGRNKPDGTEVTEEEFADFLDAVITPEFPDGLTVLSGVG